MKTTKKHFELFKKECKYWIDKLELSNYDVRYKWEELDHFDEAQSKIKYNYTVVLYLDTDWEEEVNNKEVKEAAKHEIVHLLLGRLTLNAEARFIGRSEIDEAMEEVVRKLTRIIK